jgi:2-polyprenyl-3-methyl-5-hydroxy-6-metoxy-1,4-benzoquinol methylase
MAVNYWEQAKTVIGAERVNLGPQVSQQYLDAPDHLGMVIARYRTAAAMIGRAQRVVEFGCGEGIGATILAKNRECYLGVDADAEGIRIARETVRKPYNGHLTFTQMDLTNVGIMPGTCYDAVVSLDVIEHIPPEADAAFMTTATVALSQHGVCVIGTPSLRAEHLASPQSKAGHINLYTPDRLRALMSRYFHVVQMLFMQDTSVHFGHPDMAHYVIAVGIGPRRGG